mmetsp:Transcript_34367/g.77409  ORF Transcript_34367/g.77409 Transcript_34367/m.77409 type:complete len:441 (-) Transcript_34367:19-1341(-)
MRSLPVLSIVLTTTFLERCSSFSRRCALVGRSPCVGSVGRTPRLRQLRPGILEEVEAPVQLDKGSAEVAVREQAQSQQQLDESNEDEATAERGLGILVLLTVPLAWGTYTPAVKYMYEMEPAIPGFVFSAGYYLVAAVTLRLLSSLQANESNELKVDRAEESEEGLDIRGGWELGSYLFVGNALQVVGLQTVPADRAAFLVQLTTVLVPLVAALSVGALSAVPAQTWLACVVAFVGVSVMGIDDGGVGAGISGGNPITLLHVSPGDLLIVLAAFSYTLHVVRLGVYAPRTKPLALASAKATTEAFLSVAVVIILTIIGNNALEVPQFMQETGQGVISYFDALKTAASDNPRLLEISACAILWTGWVTCAYTIYAQSYGQSKVSPTESNLIYTTQPLFSSLFAYFLLGETLGAAGYVGATLICLALWLVSSPSDITETKTE